MRKGVRSANRSRSRPKHVFYPFKLPHRTKKVESTYKRCPLRVPFGPRGRAVHVVEEVFQFGAQHAASEIADLNLHGSSFDHFFIKITFFAKISFFQPKNRLFLIKIGLFQFFSQKILFRQKITFFLTKISLLQPKFHFFLPKIFFRLNVSFIYFLL